MEQAKENIKRQKKKVFRNFIALMIGSLTLLISIAIKFNFSYAKIIVNCASSMLFGCASATKQDTYNMLQESTEIELEYAVPDYDNAEDSKVELLPWLQLASLETHPELRKAFEELLGVTVSEDGTKTGIIYTDETGKANQNNTLFNALGKNNLFIDTIRDTEKSEKIESIASDNYTDIEGNSSGKHKGQTTISKRGRSKLRAVLFNAAIPLIAKNPEFKSLHEYYTTRANNPLKKKQSVIVISCKLIRVFYAILANGVTYDPQKMLSDIHRQPQAA